MARADQVITEGAQPFLQAGEQVLAAAPRGNTQRVAGGLGLDRGKVGKNVEAGEAAGLRIEAPFALALTDQRLLSLAYGNPIGMGIGGKVRTSSTPCRSTRSRRSRSSACSAARGSPCACAGSR